MTRKTARILKLAGIRQPAHEAAIGIGDLVRAVGLLEPDDDETLRAIAAALGFEMELPPTTRTDEEQATSDQAEAAPRAADFVRRRTVPEPVWPPPLLPGRAVVSFEVEKQAAPPPVRPAVKYQAMAETRTARLPLAPLFRPNWSRAIISSLLATDGGQGPIDLDGLVHYLARREHVTALPRLPWPTLGRGVQMLIDRGPAMAPFWRDQDHLYQQIVNVVGGDKVRAFTFAGYPLPSPPPDDDRPWGTFPLEPTDEGQPEDLETADPPGTYRPPLAGVVVLLLTDLGIGRPLAMSDRVSTERWLAFATLVRKAGCPLVACVPYPPTRWPIELRHALKIVPWDRTTTATLVRNLIGRTHLVNAT